MTKDDADLRRRGGSERVIAGQYTAWVTGATEVGKRLGKRLGLSAITAHDG
jgi:hypothetical protein